MKVILFDGDKLRQIRIEKNISQRQLAEKIGVQKALISHWERNMVKNPGEDSVRKICEVLEIEKEVLYKQEEAEEKKKKVFDGGMLRFLRESGGYSQKELAVKVGLKGGEFTISKMERGVIGCKGANVKKMARFFGVDEQDFYVKDE